MTFWKRIQNLLLVFLQLIFIFIMLISPILGKYMIVISAQILLLGLGIRYLIFYFTMARYMVDGRSILYQGGIYLDLGIFLSSTFVVPSSWIMIYLIGYFLLSGVYRCLKVMDTRKVEDGKWIRVAFVAAFYLMLAIIGVLNLRNESTMVYLFCIEMLVSAMNRLARVIRKTAIVYIQ